jgi:hypothetical protein
MRDAESMLDQLLGSAAGRIDEAGVRDLLGLAEAEAVDRLVAALVGGDAAAGIGVLDALDDRGRDVGVVLDQVIEAIRAELSSALGPGGDPVRVVALARVARRLAEIDPERRGVGGLRLQVELALFAASAGSPQAAAPSASVAGPTANTPSPTPGPVATPPAAIDVEPPAEPPPAAKPTQKRQSGKSSEAAAPDANEPAPNPADPAIERSAAGGGDAPPTGAAPNPELERLINGWVDVVASVRPATRAVITECRPMAVDGNVVTLGFPEAKAFLKDVAERKRPDLEAAVGGYLGRAVAVRCVATNLDLVPPPPADDTTDPMWTEARRIFAEDLADVGEVS